jgi:hypothetical protein
MRKIGIKEVLRKINLIVQLSRILSFYTSSYLYESVENRTRNPQIRNLMLYPIELQTLIFIDLYGICVFISNNEYSITIANFNCK